MDDGWFDLVEVLKCVDDLHDDGARLLLRHQLVLLQVEVQIVPLAELKNRAEPDPMKTNPTTMRKETCVYVCVCVLCMFSGPVPSAHICVLVKETEGADTHVSVSREK